jgi:MFS transporter, FLVCR family, MFS-domain-containing protein 7
MGAALLLPGILAAIATSPVFDRILTYHLGITVRILCPIIGVAWLSLIWAGKETPSHPFRLDSSSIICAFLVKSQNAGALFSIFVIIGVGSITLLPVGVELAVELTRNSDGSSAVLWFLCVPHFTCPDKFLPKLTFFLLLRFPQWKSYMYCLHSMSASPFTLH